MARVSTEIECKKCKNPVCTGPKLGRLGFTVVECKYGGAVEIYQTTYAKKIKNYKQEVIC